MQLLGGHRQLEALEIAKINGKRKVVAGRVAVELGHHGFVRLVQRCVPMHQESVNTYRTRGKRGASGGAVPDLVNKVDKRLDLVPVLRHPEKAASHAHFLERRAAPSSQVLAAIGDLYDNLLDVVRNAVKLSRRHGG